MREIKFRGKRVDNGEWVYGPVAKMDVYECGKDYEEIVIVDQLKYDDRDYYVQEFIDADAVDTDTVGQFTGLKDKNGVEIYEGDIVAFEDSDGGYEHQDVVVNTGIVEYGELRFYFTNRVAVEMDDFYIKDGRCDDVEVIGNIHDNPELIGVKNE